MKISHEVPICLLDESRKFNDYDYALVHLFDKFEEYKKFYIESLNLNREVYLDNSAFELETMFDHKQFAKAASELSDINSKNFYYIVPDSLENYKETKQSFIDFTNKYKIKGKKIGVVQGKTFDELLDCFKFMKENADVIAISFDYSYYLKNNLANKFKQYMAGRQSFINFLNNNGYLKNTKIHLLGCSLPQEFSVYKEIKEIISCDTSNPIVHGIINIEYKNYGLDDKESIKLNDLINIKKNKINQCVYDNITKFRELVNGL